MQELTKRIADGLALLQAERAARKRRAEAVRLWHELQCFGVAQRPEELTTALNAQRGTAAPDGELRDAIDAAEDALGLMNFLQAPPFDWEDVTAIDNPLRRELSILAPQEVCIAVPVVRYACPQLMRVCIETAIDDGGPVKRDARVRYVLRFTELTQVPDVEVSRETLETVAMSMGHAALRKMIAAIRD